MGGPSPHQPDGDKKASTGNYVCCRTLRRNYVIAAFHIQVIASDRWRLLNDCVTLGRSPSLQKTRRWATSMRDGRRLKVGQQDCRGATMLAHETCEMDRCCHFYCLSEQ
jgi:hypothetical protein